MLEQMTELEEQAERVLREMGLEPGQSVLDFGCGSGTYAIPAARIVGGEGADATVYAVDKAWWGMWPGESLAKLARTVRSRGLENICIMKTSGELSIDLADEAVDVVLLHDTLHSYYFSPDEIRGLLREVYRVLQPNGFLSLYPGDPEVSGDRAQLRDIEAAVESTGLRPEAGYTGQVVHENTIVRGHVRKFRKPDREQQ